MTDRPRPGVDNPGIVDGDVLHDLFAEMMPRHWIVEEARSHAEKILTEMHRVGFIILRGVNSQIWTPPAPDDTAHQAAVEDAIARAADQFKNNWPSASPDAYARAAVDHALRQAQRGT